MKILIIEDDEAKRAQLSEFLNEQFEDAEIKLAKSFQSGLKTIVQESDKLDFLLLDMSLPTFDIGSDDDGGRPQAYAGREILNQMDRRNISIPVIVVTQFEIFGEGSNILTRQQLDEQLRRAHSKNYIGTVYYNAAFSEWKDFLNSIIVQIKSRRKA